MDVATNIQIGIHNVDTTSLSRLSKLPIKVPNSAKNTTTTIALNIK